MDACFYADNLYNNFSFNGKPPMTKDPVDGPIEWSVHLDNMMSLMQTLGNAAREGQLSSEMSQGTFDERGPVVLQIKRKLTARNVEPPIPAFVPNVDPWGRYKTFELELKKNYKGKDLDLNEHPTASRELAIFYHNERYVERAGMIRNAVTRPKSAMLTWSKRFECSAFWGMMPLLEIDGKVAPGTKVLPTGERLNHSINMPSKLPNTRSTELIVEPQILPAPVGCDAASVVSGTSTSSLPPPDPTEVKAMAELKSHRLHETIVAVAMNGPMAHHHTSAEENLGRIIFKKGLYGTTPTKSVQNQSHDEDEREQTPAKTVTRKYGIEKQKISIPGDGSVGGHDPSLGIMTELRQKCVSFEKERLAVKLLQAKAEVNKVACEQRALEAKMTHAKAEVELIEQSILAHEEAERKLMEL